MRKGIRKILVTGGAGFIGSEFLRQLIRHHSQGGVSLAVIDKLTYAGDLKRIEDLKGKYRFYKADISDKTRINAIFEKERPHAAVHFAAETHVDRSIKDASAFIETNVNGTHVLIDASRKYGIERFIQISTDEVYGEIGRGSFTEESPLRPNSPYAASKASADLLIRSYVRTYGFPAIIVRPCNNYGPWQYPEKLIPLSILKLLNNEKVPVYGDGRNVREWLFVSDCARGIADILRKGKDGEIYNLGNRQEKKNIEVVKEILKILKRTDEMIEFVKDRPGHDIRYSLDSSRVLDRTGWRPLVRFEQGIKESVQWYLKNKEWLLGKAQRRAR